MYSPIPRDVLFFTAAVITASAAKIFLLAAEWIPDKNSNKGNNNSHRSKRNNYSKGDNSKGKQAGTMTWFWESSRCMAIEPCIKDKDGPQRRAMWGPVFGENK